MAEAEPRVTIAHIIPTYKTWEFDVAQSVLEMVSTWQDVAPAHWDLKRVSVRAQPVDACRNLAVRDALRDFTAEAPVLGPAARRVGSPRPADVILFQDTDVFCPDPRDMVHLADTLWAAPADVAAVGAPVVIQNTHGNPQINVNFNGFPAEQEGFSKHWQKRAFQCAGVGFGLIAIRASVFASLEWPWFRFEYGDIDEPRGIVIGEDLGWCDKVRAAGFRVFADGRIRALHLHARAVSIQDSPEWLALSGAKKKEEGS